MTEESTGFPHLGVVVRSGWKYGVVPVPHARAQISAAVLLLALCGGVDAARVQPPLGSPPAPAGNPTTEPKRLLGKILFWDEQLSSSNALSCGTCHAPSAGGGEPRRARHPGSDELFETGDDAFGSPGQPGTDADNGFSPAHPFAFASQVTVRSAQSVYLAAYGPFNFWDGRAGPAFTDPQTGSVVLPAGAALEMQAVQPLLNRVEMGHFGRSGDDVAAKVAASRPLALADQLPADVATALAGSPGYPQLFEQAFGTPDVTLARIAMAIAAYERTLVPNQTPWDRYAGGEAEALTPLQLQGLAVFNSDTAKCSDCHAGNRFTDNVFHNIGVRPVDDDPGRESTTGLFADRGRFKTPTLRNAALRPSFFHNGQAQTLRQTIDFYGRAQGAMPQFADNLDPGVQGITLSVEEADALEAFIADGLTDPRVVAAEFPFDHPRLWSSRVSLAPQVVGGGQAAQPEGTPPVVIAFDPALIGAPCRIGLGAAPAGWSAVLRIGDAEPVAGVVEGEQAAVLTVNSEGAATARPLIDPAKHLAEAPLYVQWSLSAEPGGPVTARSTIARIVPFCQRGGCEGVCRADLGKQGGLIGKDGQLDSNDFVAFIDLFFSHGAAADLGRQGGLAGADGAWDNNDFVVFIDAFFAGC